MADRTGIEAAKTVARERYAMPGGYALALVTEDGGELCPDCVRAEFRSIVDAHLRADNTGGWMPAGWISNDDTDDLLNCDHCDRDIN